MGTSGKPVVFVVNYPLKYFVERIGGLHVEVAFPAPGDEDPAFWNPDVEVITRYQQADAILLNGAGYAGWTGKVSLPNSKMVDTSRGFSERYVPMGDAMTHSHGPGGEHAHGDMAFTTWLDPALALEQARVVRDTLSRIHPNHKKDFEAAYAGLERDLLQLDEDLKKVVSASPGRPLLFSHPVYQYLIRRYGLSGKSVHWEPGEMPDEGMWTELAELTKEHPAKWMVWEGEPNDDIAAKLGTMGIQSVVFDPCGNVPEEGDYLEVMKRNLDQLKTAFQ